MKHLLILVITSIFLVFCSCRVTTPARPHRAFVLPPNKSHHHWGAPRRWDRHTRYWSKHRYGMHPHPRRGRFH